MYILICTHRHTPFIRQRNNIKKIKEGSKNDAGLMILYKSRGIEGGKKGQGERTGREARRK